MAPEAPAVGLGKVLELLAPHSHVLAVFDGEFDVALERSAAFCRVVALGQATLADGAEHGNEAHASKLTRNSHQLVKTAEDLEHAANAWRLGELD